MEHLQKYCLFLVLGLESPEDSRSNVVLFDKVWYTQYITLGRTAKKLLSWKTLSLEYVITGNILSTRRLWYIVSTWLCLSLNTSWICDKQISYAVIFPCLKLTVQNEDDTIIHFLHLAWPGGRKTHPACCLSKHRLTHSHIHTNEYSSASTWHVRLWKCWRKPM